MLRKLDRYTAAAAAMFFVEAVLRWQDHVRVHEAIYLLGARRVADPDLLARDLSWGVLPPTTFLFDHLLAPVVPLLGDFGAVNVGRVVVAALFAWSLASLGRELRLPALALVGGFVAWLYFGQTLVSCGAPLDGFQPKSPAYPLLFFALVFAMREQWVRAGLSAGLAAVFHIIIGGWGCLALLVALLARRAPARAVFRYLAGTAPLCGPLVLAVGLFHAGGATGLQSQMDAIYVRFAEPHCCDPSFFLDAGRLAQTVAAFGATTLLAFLWPAPTRLFAAFVAALVGFAVLGFVASPLALYPLLKLYPFQLAVGLSVLWLFVLTLSFFAERPRWRAPWFVALGVSLWLFDEEDVLKKVVKAPRNFAREVTDDDPPGRYGPWDRVERHEPLLRWIRENTPRDALFVTPYMPEFWTYAERAQVVSFRHPPLNERLTEWHARLEILNGSKPFENRGFEVTDELDASVARLDPTALAAIRDRFGATHYVTKGIRPELEAHLLFEAGGYSLYDLSKL